MQKLLLCPFCGSEAELHYLGWKDGANPWWGHQCIQCTQCDCRGPIAEDTDGAISAWTQRASSEVHDAKVEMLERICAETYCVLGVVADEAGRFDDPAVVKALDNLAEQALLHDDVLPFSAASELKPSEIPPVVITEELEEAIQELGDWLDYEAEPSLPENFMLEIKAIQGAYLRAVVQTRRNVLKSR